MSKTFPGLRALDDVSLTVAPGEIVAVVGQNGSGKSTLVKVFAGIHAADPGAEILVRGPDGSMLQGSEAREELHFIHQDLGLVPLLSTIENLDLGRRLGRRDIRPAPVREETRRATELIERFGASFDVRAPMAELTAAERTIVAIARALERWTRPDHVLVLDEPTAALHGDEVNKLFEAVRRVAQREAGVIFISHRLDEVIELADRVVALRDGRVVANARRGEFDHDELVRMIAGRDVEAAAATAGASGEVVFRARAVAGSRMNGIDLDLRAGEVVGVTGLLGSGREQLAGTLFGALPRTGGDVQVEGATIPPSDPRTAIRRGVAYVPADRRRAGAVMSMSARENLTLPRLGPLRRRFARLDSRGERREAHDWFRAVDLRPNQPERPLEQFSGGNQQKVVLAKWLRNEPRVLLLDDPTQGVDVGSKAAIYDLVARAARAGAAVLFSSSETKELAALCDRVLVLRDGRVASEVEHASLTEARLITEALRK